LDKTPPRLTVIAPRPDELVLGPLEVCFEVDDGDFTESQCDLKSLHVKLDGAEPTQALTRRHFIDIAQASGVTLERIELHWLTAHPDRVGAHHLEVEIRDRANNLTTRSWTFYSVFKGDADSPLPRLLKEGPDEAALEWLKKKPEHAWGYLSQPETPRIVQMPLWEAVLYKRAATARWLVEQGVPLKAFGFDSLRRAAGTGWLDMVQLMVEHGAAVDLPLALEGAATGGQTEVVRYLLKAGADPRRIQADPPLLHQIAALGHGPALALLLPFFPDHDTRDAAGGTALHRAKSAEVVRVLLQAGFDPNARDRAGKTPLEVAGGDRAR